LRAKDLPHAVAAIGNRQASSPVLREEKQEAEGSKERTRTRTATTRRRYPCADSAIRRFVELVEEEEEEEEE
jgi:hypothetical protein